MRATLSGMDYHILDEVKWLSITNNEGMNADDLKIILEQLPNLERLSLNSNGFWKLPRDMFQFNSKLKSISLHNNALTCLDGVFDDLIDNVS